MKMSGLCQVEMSGSRYAGRHVGTRPDDEQARIRACGADAPGPRTRTPRCATTRTSSAGSVAEYTARGSITDIDVASSARRLTAASDEHCWNDHDGDPPRSLGACHATKEA
jgi:hypothetical protein